MLCSRSRVGQLHFLLVPLILNILSKLYPDPDLNPDRDPKVSQVPVPLVVIPVPVIRIRPCLRRAAIASVEWSQMWWRKEVARKGRMWWLTKRVSSEDIWEVMSLLLIVTVKRRRNIPLIIWEIYGLIWRVHDFLPIFILYICAIYAGFVSYIFNNIYSVLLWSTLPFHIV